MGLIMLTLGIVASIYDMVRETQHKIVSCETLQNIEGRMDRLVQLEKENDAFVFQVYKQILEEKGLSVEQDKSVSRETVTTTQDEGHAGLHMREHQNK